MAPILASSATKADADSATVCAPPSGGSFSVAAGGTHSGGPSSASVGSRPPSAALGAPPLGGPPSVAAGAPPSGGSSGSAPSVRCYVSAPSGSSVVVGAPPSGGPSGSVMATEYIEIHVTLKLTSREEEDK